MTTATEGNPWAGLGDDRYVGRQKVRRTPWYNAIYASGIGAYKVAILTAMARYGNPDGSSISPSAQRIAKDLGIDRGTVEKHINESDALGWITPEQRRDGKGGYIPGVRGRGFHCSIPFGWQLPT